MKICKLCKKDKNDSEYSKGQGKCRECRQKIRNINYKELKQKELYILSTRLELRKEYLDLVKSDCERLNESFEKMRKVSITTEELEEMKKDTNKWEISKLPDPIPSIFRETHKDDVEKGYIHDFIGVYDKHRDVFYTRLII